MARGGVEVFLAGKEGKGVLGARRLGGELDDDLALIGSDRGRSSRRSGGGIW